MENWKAVEGYEGLYEVSDLGRVRNAKEKVLKTWILNSGYECVGLKDKRSTVHRLVAKAFCGGYAEGLVVNHIDANRLNNAASNLEWCTTKFNVADTIARGTHNVTAAQQSAKIKNLRPVEMLDPHSLKVLAWFPSMKEAEAQTKVSRHKISLVCAGKRRTTGGYKWRKAE